MSCKVSSHLDIVAVNGRGIVIDQRPFKFIKHSVQKIYPSAIDCFPRPQKIYQSAGVNYFEAILKQVPVCKDFITNDAASKCTLKCAYKCD